MYHEPVFPFVFFPFVLLFGFLGFLICIGGFIFWIAMLIDLIKRKFKNETDKIVWVIVLIFTHIVGALIYYFLVKKNHKK